MESLRDRYAFLAVLGQGGAGTVYQVRNLLLGRLEALKTLSQGPHQGDLAQRFIQEARVAASLDHPRIVKVHDFGQEGDIYWYSMQLVEGPTLSGLMEAGWRLDENTLAQVALPLMDALAYSHNRGIIHRDIKPANILFSPEGRPFLTDFGIAKTRESTLHTHTGRMMGTPAYVSPEQALGEEVDARSDQYSLAITLYKATTGHLPFAGDEFLQTLVQRVNQPPVHLLQHLPEMDPDFAAVIMRALERERAARFEDIGEMKAALQRACSGRGITPLGSLGDLSAHRPEPHNLENPTSATGAAPTLAPTADLPTSPPPSRSRTLPIAALGLLVVALAVGAFRLSHRNRGTEAGQVSQESLHPPAPSLPDPKPSPTEVTSQKPAAARKPGADPTPPPAPRPLSYPQIIEEPPEELRRGAAPCAGSHVILSLTVEADGHVSACRPLTSISEACADTAHRLGMQYRFRPARDAQGQPVRATIAVTLDFPEAP